MPSTPRLLILKDANSGLLSNFELIELLRSRGATQDPLGSFGSATHSECKVFDYLVQSAACNQTLETVQDFLLKVEKFSLTKAERLQVLNLRPSTAVEVHLIVEDCEERMPSSVVDELLETVRNTWPPPPEKPEEEEENAEADEVNDEDMDDAGAEEQEE